MTALFRKFFPSTKNRAPAQEPSPDRNYEAFTDALTDVKRELANLSDRLASLESEPRGLVPSGSTLRLGMNLNKRTQALRQHRLGRPPSEIARNLEMPKAEIDLLVKVHRIVSQ